MRFKWRVFLTLVRIARNQFCTRPIKECIGSDELKKHFPSFENFPPRCKEEIKRALYQEASSFFLRAQEEVDENFIDFLGDSELIHFKKILAVLFQKIMPSRKR